MASSIFLSFIFVMFVGLGGYISFSIANFSYNFKYWDTQSQIAYSALLGLVSLLAISKLIYI